MLKVAYQNKSTYDGIELKNSMLPKVGFGRSSVYIRTHLKYTNFNWTQND